MLIQRYRARKGINGIRLRGVLAPFPLWAPGGRHSMGIADRLIEELRSDGEKRRELARLLVPEVYSDKDLRVATLNALYSEVATRDDIEALKSDLRRDIERLEARIKDVEQRIDSLLKWVIGLLATMWATLIATLLATTLR